MVDVYIEACLQLVNPAKVFTVPLQGLTSMSHCGFMCQQVKRKKKEEKTRTQPLFIHIAKDVNVCVMTWMCHKFPIFKEWWETGDIVKNAEIWI